MAILKLIKLPRSEGYRQENNITYEVFDISDMLPTPAVINIPKQPDRFYLKFLDPVEFAPDPVILEDYRNTEIFRWNYTPSLGEVFDKCRELGIA